MCGALILPFNTEITIFIQCTCIVGCALIEALWGIYNEHNMICQAYRKDIYSLDMWLYVGACTLAGVVGICGLSLP